jgi:hypothetical protein
VNQHSPHRVSLISCALLFSLFLTSCTTHQKYPSEWSALIPVGDDKCPDISGTYTIKGERIGPSFDVDKFKIESPEIATNRESLREDRQSRSLYLYEVLPMEYFVYRDPIIHTSRIIRTSRMTGVSRIIGATHAQILRPDNETLEISFLDDQDLIDKKITL